MSKIPRVMAAMLAALTAALLLAGAALAQPTNPPHTFYGYAGDVTLDGNSVPGGTTINAQADGVTVASGVVGTDGSWKIDVPADAGSVNFAIGDAVSSAAYPVSSAGTLQVKLALTTPEPEPEVTEPEEGTEGGDDGSMTDGLEGEGDDGSMTDDGLEGEGDDGSMTDDGDGDGSMTDDGDGDGSMTEDGDGDGSMTEDGDGDGSTTDELDEEGDSGESMMDGEDGAMDGDTDTVGGVTGLGSTGTGGLADGGSSAALWSGIGSALALIALLGGGFAVRRRAQSRS